MADPTEDPIWTAHEGCDQRIAELEADKQRLRGVLIHILALDGNHRAREIAGAALEEFPITTQVNP